MFQRSSRAVTSIALVLGVIVVIATLVLVAGEARRLEQRHASNISLRPSSGSPRQVSVAPLPETNGEMCEWTPIRTAAALPQERLSARSAAAAVSSEADVRSANDADRAPLRVIRDTYPTYSAIAVDLNSNEVFLEDENLFGIKVFNRTDNTPPGAGFTEPKRLLGGTETKLEFNCGLYIDPKSGDVYSVANDVVDTLVIFPHDAQGNVAPKRQLHTPHGTYGITVDEAAQELYLTAEHNNGVVVYPKMAAGEQKPIRAIEGGQTRLGDPHGIAIDTKNNWMFVSNHGATNNRKAAGTGKFEPPSLAVYPLEASGDTAPIPVIQGPKAQLNWPAAMYLDQENGELYVANDSGDSVLVFRETDQGDVAPLRVIEGPDTQLSRADSVAADPHPQLDCGRHRDRCCGRSLWNDQRGRRKTTDL